MSCIACRLAIDGRMGADLDLASMIHALRPRAPDGVTTVCDGPAALAQLLLRTGSSAVEQAGRPNLGEDVWIVADARVDRRAELVRELVHAGRDVGPDTPHSELILHAYLAFADGFLDHVHGDFAFALWDGRRRQLICARDRLGVRPLHLWRRGAELALASHVEGLLALPGVSRELDEVSVADFLMLGINIDAERTIYRDIRALPPATRVDVREGRVTQTVYWKPSWGGEIRYPKPHEYVERFAELLDNAVQERMPSGPVAIPLSGGMDSTSIAAVAAPRAGGQRITAYHITSASLIAGDDEEPLARSVADKLGLDFVRQDLGRYAVFERVHARGMRTAVPSPAPLLAVHCDMVEDMERRGARTLLSGYAGDAVICPTPDYYARLIRSGRLAKFVREACGHIAHTRSLRGMALRSVWQRRRPPAWRPAWPEWIDRELAHRVQARSRWDSWWERYQDAFDTPKQLAMPGFRGSMEAVEILRKPVIARYPFLDLRLIEFLAALPNYVKTDKWIAREAMRGLLPEAVRTRPKTGAPGDPVRELVTKSTLALGNWTAGLSSMVDRDAYAAAWRRYRQGEGEDTTWSSWLLLQPAALAHWIKQQQE